MIATRPGVVLKFSRETVEQNPGGVSDVDPVVLDRVAQRFSERLEMEAKHQQDRARAYNGMVADGWRRFWRGSWFASDRAGRLATLAGSECFEFLLHDVEALSARMLAAS